MGRNVVLRGTGVKKTYLMGEVAVNALNGVDFELYAGEFVVILGPSGSGKSTLLNIIGGMDTATAGELYFGSRALHGAGERALTAYRRNAVGFIFQFYNLMPGLTALENIRLAADISPAPLDAKELLSEIDLLDRASHFPAQLSGGQQQRVAIARALVKNPDLLLCDEPTGALDIATGIGVLKLLKNFNKTYKKTVLVITHNASIAAIADRVFYIRDGLIERVAENETPISPEEVSW